MKEKRSIYFYENHFKEFYLQQNPKVQKKILWTLRLIETIERIPELYFKHIENSDGLYEIRVQHGNNIFRIFCFFEQNDLIVVCHGFQKKTQKTPVNEIQRAVKLKNKYYEEKESDQP